ncbi:MAG: hypothetical protein WCP69_13095 [Bacteroidota bacterium]
MNIFENFKIDVWWKAVLLIGCLLIAASFFFNITFINPKHLFGLGLGLSLIGLSYFIANKHAHTPVSGGFLVQQITQHNFVTILLLIIGIVISVMFFIFLLIQLIC